MDVEAIKGIDPSDAIVNVTDGRIFISLWEKGGYRFWSEADLRCEDSAVLNALKASITQ